MRIKNFAVVAAIIWCLLTFPGCFRHQGIIGKWQQENGQESVEYFQDGTFIAHNGGQNISGKYVVVDDHRLKIELNGLGALAGPVISTFTLSGDELTMTGPNNETAKYRRTD